MNGTMGYVYFAEAPASKLIKIGWSQTPFVRLETFKRTHGKRVKILGCMKGTLRDEKRIHGILKEHLYGAEWFHDSEIIRNYIAKHCIEDLNSIRSEYVKFRMNPFHMDRLRKIALRENITITQVMQRALEQISDQGCTDKIIIRGKI